MEQVIDNAFHVARARALETLSLQKDRHFIGVYGEKLLHSTLKFYYQPNPDYHEMSLGTMVADACIFDENGECESVEIQTGSFFPLRRKLQKYKAAGERVRVVMPLAAFLIIYFFPIPTEAKQTFYIICSCPAASIVLNFAEIIGEGQKEAASSVILSTIMSIATLPVMMLLLPLLA